MGKIEPIHLTTIERETMEIEVYDTYATSEKGIKIHFDVMIPTGGNEGEASSYAQEFLKNNC